MARKHTTEYICGLRDKIQIMGISINGLTYVYRDNKSAFCNTTAPNLCLKKKYNSIAYYFIILYEKVSQEMNGEQYVSILWKMELTY